jgi:integrase
MPRPKKQQPKTHERQWHEGSVLEVRPGVFRAWRERVRRPDGSSTRPSKTFTDREAAERWARGEPEPKVMLVGQWLDRWYALRYPLIRPSTRVNYRRFIAACEPIALCALADVERDDWQALANSLLDRWARGSVGAWRSIISSALLAAVPRHLDHNPMAGVRLPKLGEQLVKAWSADEVSRLLEAAEGYPHALWLTVSIGTGIRLGEARALLRDDVDRQARALTISKSVDNITDEVGPTKSGKIRRVDVPDELMPLLVEALARQRPGTKHVFDTRSAGKPYDPNTYRDWIAKLCDRAGVTRFTPHATRHTYATLALDAGVPLKEVSEQLGHANVAITAAIYSHAVEKGQRRAAAALGKALTRRPPTRLAKDGSPNGSREQA